MLDNYGREIDYLRLSVTERCNLNCIYCRDDSIPAPVMRELTVEEIARIVEQMVKLQVTKVRITGGEPLMRCDLEQIIAEIAKFNEITDLCMTTNAQGLVSRIRELKKAGLHRLNISIDSLHPHSYAKMTRGGHLNEVLKGIDAAICCGIGVKTNTVLVRGENDGEIDDFIHLAKVYPIDVRFIELMPIGIFGQDSRRRVTSAEILARYPKLYPVEPRYRSQPAEDYTAEGFQGRIGFISPVSHKFCHICNRVRLTSDGKLRMCLGNNAETDLLPVLHAGDDLLYQTIYHAIREKPRGHSFDAPFHSMRTMNRLGG